MDKAVMSATIKVGFLKYDDGTIGVRVVSEGAFAVGEFGTITGSTEHKSKGYETIEDAKSVASSIVEEHINRLTNE